MSLRSKFDRELSALSLPGRPDTASHPDLVTEADIASLPAVVQRYFPDPKDPNRTTRMRWTTPVEGWGLVNGRALWSRGKAVWNLPDGDLAYADFTPIPSSLAYNIAPETSRSLVSSG